MSLVYCLKSTLCRLCNARCDMRIPISWRHIDVKHFKRHKAGPYFTANAMQCRIEDYDSERRAALNRGISPPAIFPCSSQGGVTMYV